MKIIAQIFGIGAMIALFLIYQQKTRKRILIAKLTADLFWVAHYYFLGGTAGLIPNFVGIFREIVFLHRKSKRWAGFVFWPIFFIALNWGLALRTFSSQWDILPIAASTFVTVSLWIDRPWMTKLISLPVSLAFLIYDITVGSYVGIINESISMGSILISLFKERKNTMNQKIFTDDLRTDKHLIYTEGAPIASPQKTITARVSEDAVRQGDRFATEISERFCSDFEKPGDQMAHVSTFIVADGIVYMTYYANTHDPAEDPKHQTARLAYAPIDDLENKTFLDIQAAGDIIDGKLIDMVYDTILMQKDKNTLYVLWTARTGENYYRFYRPFFLSTKTLGEIGVNRFQVGKTVNDFSASGIRSALAENGVCCKKMYADIGIMQKLSSREENGEIYYYSGTYSGDFNCIIKSKDLITWEYVSQPDFINDSKWENATYVLKDKVFYFVRQQGENPCGFLTAYNIKADTWDTPVEVEDCQSRSDFILYRDQLYLFHAPIDREHIGILRIDTEDIANTEVVLQAKMNTSCFYPFVQYYRNGELALSYTVERKHIRLAEFTLGNYTE